MCVCEVSVSGIRWRGECGTRALRVATTTATAEHKGKDNALNALARRQERKQRTENLWRRLLKTAQRQGKFFTVFVEHFSPTVRDLDPPPPQPKKKNVLADVSVVCCMLYVCKVVVSVVQSGCGVDVYGCVYIIYVTCSWVYTVFAYIRCPHLKSSISDPALTTNTRTTTNRSWLKIKPAPLPDP